MNDFKTAVLARIKECATIAEEKGYPINGYAVSFDLKGAAAGRGGRKNGRPIIKVNLEFVKNHFDWYLEEVVPHEFAHAMQYAHFARPKPHGKEWKFFCKLLVGKELPVFHSKSFTPARVTKKYEFTCGCAGRTLTISSMRFKRLQSGSHRYVCKVCKCDLKPKEKAIFG